MGRIGSCGSGGGEARRPAHRFAPEGLPNLLKKLLFLAVACTNRSAGKHIEVPESWTANVCLGGRDEKTLFITASKGLCAIKLTVKGWYKLSLEPQGLPGDSNDRIELRYTYC